MNGKCTQIDIEYPAINVYENVQVMEINHRDIILSGKCAIIDLEYPTIEFQKISR